MFYSARSQAWAWFLLSLILSSGNDIIVKYLSGALPGIQVSFLRFFWAASLLLIAFPRAQKEAFFSTNHRIHFSRGLFLCLGMGIWTSLLPMVSLSHATIINFSIPLITLLLGRVILKEHVTLRQYQSTSLGVIGIGMTLYGQSIALSWPVAGLLIGAACFASCDVLNKVSGHQDKLIPTLFFTALYTALLSSPLCYVSWVAPQWPDLALTLLLGFNANVLFYCLLKAFGQLQLTQVASLRYLELVLAVSAGFVFFGEIPALQTMIGGCIVILGATWAITEQEDEQVVSPKETVVPALNN